MLAKRRGTGIEATRVSFTGTASGAHSFAASDLRKRDVCSRHDSDISFTLNQGPVLDRCVRKAVCCRPHSDVPGGCPLQGLYSRLPRRLTDAELVPHLRGLLDGMAIEIHIPARLVCQFDSPHRPTDSRADSLRGFSKGRCIPCAAVVPCCCLRRPGERLARSATAGQRLPSRLECFE